MNVFSLSYVMHSLAFIADSLFVGLKFAIPILFLLNILRIRINKNTFASLTKAANSLLLMGGILFFLTIAINLFVAWQSENEFELQAFISIATGAHWFQFMIPIFSFAFLPNILWIKRLRKSINASFLLVICWYLSKFMVDYLTLAEEINPSHHSSLGKIPMTEYFEKSIVFAILFTVTFMIVNRKQYLYIDENRNQA